MARAVVKFSLNAPKPPEGQQSASAPVRKAARAALKANGVFHGAGTSNLHAEARTQQEIFTAIGNLFVELSRAQEPVTVDHVWLYFDNEHEVTASEEIVH